MKRIIHVLTICLFFAIVTSCGASAELGGSSTPDYESTKKMMVDMLKTDDGKKAIQELMKEEEMRHQLVMDNDFIKETVQTTLTSEAGKKFWQDIMKDPEFAKTFAESMQKENEKMLKALMKDPEYQGMMMTVLKDPEMEKALLEVLKSKEYRHQVMTIMSESFESPFFTAKVNEILTHVAEKQMEKQGKEEKKKEEKGKGGSGGTGEEKSA
ncbi:spore gernimation protein GerD [bacterium LRH843]|nr:spore gernimation protein GerD [bacterium LRH843]